MKRRRVPARRTRRRSKKRVRYARPLWVTHLVTVTICVTVLFGLAVIARLMK